WRRHVLPDRQPWLDACGVLWLWSVAGIDAMRLPDDSDSVRSSGWRGRKAVDASRLYSFLRLCVGNGGGLWSSGPCGGLVRPKPASGVANALGARLDGSGVCRSRAVDVRSV